MFLVDGQRVVLPEAFGESVNTFGGRRQYIAPGGLNLAKLYATYGEIYRAQLWVGAVVRKRANALARLPLRFPGEDGRLTALLGATPGMNPFTLVRWIQSTEDIYGEAMLLKVRVGGEVVALLPLHPTKTQVVVTVVDDAQHVEYWFQGHLGGAPLFRFDPSEIVHFKEYNPDELWRGLSALESLRETLANEDAARRATKSFWENGARPGMVVEHPQQLSDDGIQRLRASVDAAHAGADNTGATLVLEEGATAKIVQLSAEEMQYILSRKLNREEVCGCYDMPPPVVHILDQATYCLPADSLVMTGRGSVPIVDVAVTDEVWSLKVITPDGHSALCSQKVLRSVQTGVKPLLTVCTAGRKLRCTDNHPLLVSGRGWVPAGELAVGDMVMIAENDLSIGYARIVSIEADVEAVPVYDLEVDGSHNFIAEGVIVHNSNITEQMRSLYRDTMTPPIQNIEATLLDQLIKPDFPDLFDAGVTATVDMSGVLRGDWETRVTSVSAAVQNSLLTPAEGRKILDLDPIDDPNADQLYANAALTRLDSPSRMTSPSLPSLPVTSTTPEFPPADLPPLALPPGKASLSLRSIMGRLGTVKADKTQLKAALVAEHSKVIAAHLAALPPVYDPAIHPAAALAADLVPLGQATVRTFGDLTAGRLGGRFDPTVAHPETSALVADAAGKIVVAHRQRLTEYAAAEDDALVDPASDDAVTATADRSALTQVTALAAFGGFAAAAQAGGSTKTWVTGGTNPRPSHAALDGETVDIGDVFSNGLRWPGDSQSDNADEIAGCNCDVTFSNGGT